MTALATALLSSLRHAVVTKSASCTISKPEPAKRSAKAAPAASAGTFMRAAPWWVIRPGAVRSTDQ